jgi:hypothetical protein
VLSAENCPHLVIGLPSHAPSNEATVAFARRSKKLRSGECTDFSLEELTNALSRIESSPGTSELWYAIPADPTASSWKHSVIWNKDTFNLTDDLSALTDANPATAGEREMLADFLLSATLSRLLEWRWAEAGNLARATLRLSAIEARRDEALNLLAVSWLMLDEPEKALGALKKSVEGQWNLALQTNLAIVATFEDESLAVEQMSYLIDGAPDGQAMIEACRRAIRLWRRTQSEWTGSDDEDDFEPLPDRVLQSFHKVLSSSDIDEEAFYELGSFLARVDGDGLLASDSLMRSHHANSPSCALVKARAEGIPKFIKALPYAERKSSGARPWISSELDGLVDSINSALIDKDRETFVSGLAFDLVDSGLDCSTFQRTILRGFLVNAIIPIFVESDEEPNEKFIDWIHEARLASTGLELDNDQREFLDNVLGGAGNILGMLFADALLAEGQKVEDLSLGIRRRTSGILNKITANYEEIRSASRMVDSWCTGASSKCDRLEKIAVDPDVKNQLRELRTAINSVRQRVERYS